MDILKQDYVVIPFHTGVSHWWLCIIDIRNKMIYCLDSFHDWDHDLETKMIMDYLVREYNKHEQEVGNWKTSKLYGARQYDNNNCGVFVCIGISQVCSKGIPALWKTKPTKEDKSRDYTGHELLKYRLFIFKCLQCSKYHFKENACPCCGGWFEDPAEEDKRLYWIQCKKCTSSFHRSCLNNASGDWLCGKCQPAVLSNHQPPGASTDAKTSTGILIALTPPISDTPQMLTIQTEKVTPTPISIVSLPTDAVLGKLPFYVPSGNIAAYPELKDLHYDLIEVKGDGNCGVFAIFVGCIAQGLFRCPKDPYPSVVKIRRLLRKTVKDCVPALCKAQPDKMVPFFTQKKEWDEVLTSFYGPKKKTEFYRKKIRKLSKYHVQANWLPLAAAIAYRMPIIQHTKYSCPGSIEWTTSFYDGTSYDPDTHSMTIIQVDNKGIGPTRMDINPNQPPLEIFFQSSSKDFFKTVMTDEGKMVEVPEDNHVMVLRRLPIP